MKRSRIISVVLAAIAIVVVSCNKTEPVTPATLGEATIQGVIWGDLDQSDDTFPGPFYSPQLNLEYAPAGANITWIVNEFFLDPSPDPAFTYQNRSGTVAISTTDGTYSITVPAIASNVPVQLNFHEVLYDQQIFYAANPDSDVFMDNTELNNAGGVVTINVVAGGNYVYNDIYQ